MAIKEVFVRVCNVKVFYDKFEESFYIDPLNQQTTQERENGMYMELCACHLRSKFYLIMNKGKRVYKLTPKEEVIK